MLVDVLIASWDWPNATYIRTYALHSLLTSMIQKEFFRHRRAYDLPVCEDETSIQKIRNSVAQDARTCNPELIGWGWLYYRFVRVEFNFSVLEFCQLAHIDERTLRRYQAHAIHRLTLYLIKKELAAQEYLKNLALVAITYGKSTAL
jgi:hypothetical protein